MSQVVTTPEDVVNVALRRIGYRMRVGSLLEGSEAAAQCLDLYGQTRDDLLMTGDYRFAQVTANLDLLKQAGDYFITPWSAATNPQPPWLFEYTYPADALKIRAIKYQPAFSFNPRPLENLFTDANDSAYDPPRRVILCNIPSAQAIYTRQVLRPTEWNVAFVEAFAAALGKRLTPVLTNLQSVGMVTRDEGVSVAQARMEQG